MPPGGVHLLVGVLLSRFGLPSCPRVVPARFAGPLRRGIVFGSVVPDFDLLITAAVVALTEDKRYIDTLHRTATHSLPVIVAVALLAIWRCRGWIRHPDAHSHIHSAPADEASSPPADDSSASVDESSTPADPLAWRALMRLAGGSRSGGGGGCDARVGTAVAAILGVAAGCVGHTLADVFYVVPVSLFWPYPISFSYPLLLPPKEKFTNHLIKAAMLGDFASDSLFFLPLLWVCARHRMHAPRSFYFAAFWAFQLFLLAGFTHPALMDDAVHHEVFVWWLHAPWGILFICVLNASPLLLPHAIAQLAFPQAERAAALALLERSQCGAAEASPPLAAAADAATCGGIRLAAAASAADASREGEAEGAKAGRAWLRGGGGDGAQASCAAPTASAATAPALPTGSAATDAAAAASPSSSDASTPPPRNTERSAASRALRALLSAALLRPSPRALAGRSSCAAALHAGRAAGEGAGAADAECTSPRQPPLRFVRSLLW